MPKYPVRPRSAQEEQDEVIGQGLKKLGTPEQLRQIMAENAKSGLGHSPPVAKPKPRDIVASVMEEYGFSEEKAIEEIEKWGG